MVQENNLLKAQQLFYNQLELLKFIVAKGLPRAIKTSLDILGEDGGHLRSPLKPLISMKKQELKQILALVHENLKTASVFL